MRMKLLSATMNLKILMLWINEFECDEDDCKDKKDESSNDVDGTGNIVKS